MKKVFKTIEEQALILQNKGLVINDFNKAEDTLMRENYFFLNGYRHLFLKSPLDRVFIEGTTFEELYSVFNFDRQIRNIAFKNILIIENNMKSIFSYQLSKKYGYKESDYLRPKNFTNEHNRVKQVNDLIKKMKRQIRINGNKHSATQHYISNYGYIPMWIVVKVLSFGIIGELYTIMKREDQVDIANVYGVKPSDLGLYLQILANYRNLCAHEDILYDHRTQRSIDDTKYHAALDIPLSNGEYIYGKNDLFSLIIILKRLLREEEFRMLLREISYEVDVLAGKLKSIPIAKVLDAMGFPVNFQEIIDI